MWPLGGCPLLGLAGWFPVNVVEHKDKFSLGTGVFALEFYIRSACMEVD